MESILYGYAILCAVGLVQTAVMLLFQWEQYRYYRSRLRSECHLSRTPRVSLFVPCKGLDLELESNLEKLFLQDYPNYELCFVVESCADPAYAVIQRLSQRFSTPICRVVVSGVATDCGQKVHNLMVATRELPEDTEVLAFADSDARPHPQWLTRLVQRLQNEKIGVASGYRWFSPRQLTAPNWVACGINDTVAGLMGTHRFNLVWGGAWAIRATTFRELGLPGAWQGSLSDDLVISSLVHAAGLKVAFEPHCLATSPVDFTWSSLAEFVRRQFLVVRVYATRWWLSALCTTTFTVAWLLASVCLSTLWLLNEGPWWLPASYGMLHFSLMVYRVALRSRTIAPFVQTDQHAYIAITLREVLGWPMIVFCNWLGLVVSAFGRTICWRGIGYQMTSRCQTQILFRPSFGLEILSLSPGGLSRVRDQSPISKAA